MKNFIVYFVSIFILSESFCQTFNYYQRNEITGSYLIKNIEKIPEQYHFTYSKQDNQIIGYYYDSSKIKFIDIINDSRIIKSTYFSKETGNILYEKEFFYGDDLEIKSFKYRQLNASGSVVYETESFFRRQANRIIYNSHGFVINGDIEHRFIIDGALFDNYRPLAYKSYGILNDGVNKISQTFNAEETFIYDDCNNVISILFQNAKLFKLNRKSQDGNIKKYEKIFFNTDGKQISSKQYILNGSILTQIIKTNSEIVDKYNWLYLKNSNYLNQNFD